MKKPCSTTGCDREAKVKGMCQRCYGRQYKAKLKDPTAAAAEQRRPGDFVFRDRSGRTIAEGDVVVIRYHPYLPGHWKWMVLWTGRWLLRHMRPGPGRGSSEDLTEELASYCEVVSNTGDNPVPSPPTA